MTLRFPRLLLITGITALAVFAACKKPATETDTFVPGIQAAGVQFSVDDSASVVKKLGDPEYISHIPGNGLIFMYPKRGYGVQFRGLGSVYHGPLETDSSVSQVLMFPPRTIDDRKFEMCTLRSPEGASMLSTPMDIIKLYGEPPFTQLPVGKRIDDQMTGLMMYPGCMFSFRDGKMTLIAVRYSPKPDSAILKKVISQPIVPGQSLGGIAMGMTPQQVTAILGDTKYKYQKLTADFWLYPQYSLKVQFGVPPKEGAKSEQYFDTTRRGTVTGITAVGVKLFEGQVCPQSYAGATPEGFTVGVPAHLIREKLGEPLRVESTDAAAIIDGFPYWVYNGIVYFIDPFTETVHHILVTDSSLPVEMPK